jgi:nucleotide-binding universal stress UspA family protein
VADLEHILVATDFGTSSLRAVRFAAELAARLEAQLTVLHVVQESPVVYADDPGVALGFGARDDRERSAKRELDGFLESLARDATRCDGVIRVGDAAREIVAYAHESECDLLVVGTHGRSGISRLLLGSVAERIVRTSRVPVLSVRGE